MPGYTVVNLEEIEDQAPRFGYAPNVEARFARVPLELEKSGISLFRFAPGFRMPFGHRHGEQEEVYVIVRGSALIKLDDELVELREWDAVRVPAKTTRGMEAGPEGLEVLAFGAPSTGNRDAELVADFWPE